MSAELSQSPRTSPLSAADIDEAAQRISGVVARSPLQFSERLSEATGAQVYLKREDLQAVRSYKLRGAYNLLMQLTDARDRRRRGVLVGGQPRAGLRAGVPLDGHPRPGLRAGQDAEAEARPHPLPRRRVHRADRRSARPTTWPRRRRSTTSRAPVPRWCRRTTTCARWPARAPSPSRLLDQLDGEPDLVIVPVGGGGCIAASPPTWPSARRTPRCSGVEPAGAAAMIAALAAGAAGDARSRRPVRRRCGRRAGPAR